MTIRGGGALGIEEGEAGCYSAAHGQAAHVSATDAEVVHQGEQVVGGIAASILVQVGRAVRLAVAAGVPDDEAVFFREGGNLAGPLGGVASEAVGEDEGETLAVAFVVDVDSVEKGCGHGTLLGRWCGGFQYSIVGSRRGGSGMGAFRRD